MHIGIEIRYILLGPTGGVTQLLQGVLEHAFGLGSAHHFHVFCTVFNRDLLEADAGNVTFHTLPLGSYFAELDRLAVELKLDVLFRGYPNEGEVAFPMSRQIIQIPDIQHEAYPEFFDGEALRARRQAFTVALAHAGAIGTISAFSREQLLLRPETRCRDIFLMPPSLQVSHLETARDGNDPATKLIPEAPFFYFPANIWPHKNHRRLLEAFRLFRAGVGKDYELVLTGHPKGWDALGADYADLPVTHLGFVTPALVQRLLRSCEAMTYFSLYEGFGMPLLEAFSAGCAVLCSNTTSLPEVGGDAVLSCDPTDAAAIARLMGRFASEPSLKSTMVEKGRARLAAYSWNTSAASLLAACDRVASGDHGLAPVSEPVADPDIERRRYSADDLARGGLPLVSIVVPSYNQGEFLQATIDSVLSQDYPAIELLVMDGGSTDQSVDILRSYGDRFRWVSERDGGQTPAINKGMARASGEILAYLNSDDVLEPGAIGKVVECFRADSDLELVYGKAHYIDKQGAITGVYRTEPYEPRRLREECIVCQPATFWRRSLMERIGPFDESLDFVMDYDYWLRAANSGARIVHVESFLASSRLYAETKTMSARGRIYAEIFDICWRHNRFIGRDYFIGYWHHRIFERQDIWARTLRRVPGLPAILGKLQYGFVSECQRSPGRFAATLWRRLRSRALAPRRPGSGANDRSARVSGFFSDNWLSPVLRVTGVGLGPGWVGHLRGVAPVDQDVAVVVNGVRRSVSRARAGVSTLIEVVSDGSPPHVVRVSFSSHVVDPAGRKLAFLVESTNLFTEADLNG